MMALTTGGETPEFGRHGGGCCGCYGGGGCGGGCYGGHHRHHGGGCCGCYGGYSCCGCYGGYVSYGCCGCYGGGWGGCYGGGWGGGMYGPGPGGSGSDKGKTGGSGEISAPATIVVSLPEDAKLTVDSYLTKSTSASRTLQTPSLPVGQTFSYTLKVEVVRNGKTVTESRDITVQAGQVTPVSFDSPTLAVASR
jgi:uncharacterized protein (TIGR03000 family)